MDRFFLDFEASGLHPDSYPIEIGICGPYFEYEALIKPTYYWTHWSHDAQDMHGISREMIEADGVEPARICQALNDQFRGQVLWSDSNFDALWMNIMFEAAGMQEAFVVKNIMSQIDVLRLPRYLGAGNDRLEHRALADARAIRACWLSFKRITDSPQRT